jgi:hypothetical protein
VRLSIFNLLGEEVTSAVNEKLSAGRFTYSWNASNFSSGLYIYRLEAAADDGEMYTKTFKMVLVK